MAFGPVYGRETQRQAEARQFGAVVRAWYAQREDGRQPKLALSAIGRDEFCLDDGRLESIRHSAMERRKSYSGRWSDTIVAEINNRTPDQVAA